MAVTERIGLLCSSVVKLKDNVKLRFGDGASAGDKALSDIDISWSGTKLLVAQSTTNSAIDFGVDGAGIDLVLYGDTASALARWDQSADTLNMEGVAKLGTHRIVTSTQAIDYSVLAADSGKTHIATAAVNYTLPAVAGTAGCWWRFYQTVDENLVITAPANTMVAPNDATATSITFGTTAEQIGVCCEVFSDGTLYYAIIQAVEAVSITVA